MAGIKGENGMQMTKSLFYEIAEWASPLPSYTLGETALWDRHNQRWLPSALQIYVQAANEYDAMRKLVGSGKQWEQLLGTQWFPEHLEAWRAEHQHRQFLYYRNLLTEKMLSGEKGDMQAVGLLLNKLVKLTAPNPVGRPRKDKPVKAAPETNEDAGRILRFMPKGTSG